jgi:hypothetical protein
MTLHGSILTKYLAGLALRYGQTLLDSLDASATTFRA